MKETKMKETKTILVHMQEQSHPVVILNVLNCYTKGPLYCVLVENKGEKKVYKFPLCNIFRITEPY